MKIIPTIGRVVWYWREPVLGVQSQPEAGHVAYVHSESMVNLQVIGHDGRARPETSVPLCQPDDVVPAAGHYCQWMPFQVGQARTSESRA